MRPSRLGICTPGALLPRRPQSPETPSNPNTPPNSYVNYVSPTFGSTHSIFSWVAESQNDPATDPILFWTNVSYGNNPVRVPRVSPLRLAWATARASAPEMVSRHLYPNSNSNSPGRKPHRGDRAAPGFTVWALKTGLFLRKRTAPSSSARFHGTASPQSCGLSSPLGWASRTLRILRIIRCTMTRWRR